jgi:hypothetical protein
VIEARWGEDASDLAQSSLLVELSAADAEAARRLGLQGSVRAIDGAAFEGVYFDLTGKWITVDYAGEFGISGALQVRVLRSRVDMAAGLTELEWEMAI